MKIEVLFPEIANLYGDLENISYLKKSCPEAEITETHLNDEPLFVSEKPSLIYMGTMTESAQTLAVEKLAAYRDVLKARIDDGTLFLITGNALEIFGRRISDKDGTETECLGFFPTYAKRDMMNRYNSLYLGEFAADDTENAGGEPMKIVGYKSQFTHSYADENAESCVYADYDALFDSKCGPGLNPDVTGEGIRKNNFMATYIIGPILVLNPPFAKYLLAKMGIAEPELAFEEAATEAYEVRVKEYEDPNTGFYY